MRGTGSKAAFPQSGWFEALRTAASEDRELSVIGRHLSMDLAVVVDGRTTLVRLRDGKVAEVVPDPGMRYSWAVTLRGRLEDWLAFLQPEPPPFHNDLLALSGRVPSFSIEGDRAAFARHLRALGRLFCIARGVGHRA